METPTHMLLTFKVIFECTVFIVRKWTLTVMNYDIVQNFQKHTS